MTRMTAPATTPATRWSQKRMRRIKSDTPGGG
jgi:hypothetical protein